MSKAASAGMTTHIALPNMTLAMCWQVESRYGDRKAFTELDEDLLVDLADGNGFILYKAIGSFKRSAIRSTNTFSVDNLNVEGLLDPDEFSAEDVLSGRYDYAEVKIFMVNFEDLADGVIRFRRGFLGDIVVLESSFEAQLRGLLERYNDEIVGTYSPNCRADLGDLPGFTPSVHGCKVLLDPPVWLALTAYTVRPPRDAALGSIVSPTVFNDRQFKCTIAGTSGATEPAWNLTLGATTTDGTVTWEAIQALKIPTTVVTAQPGNIEFTVAYTGDAPDVLYDGGLVEFLDGLNKGFKVEIETWVLSTKTVKLSLPVSRNVFPIIPAIESELLLENGTDKLLLEDGTGTLLLETGASITMLAGCLKDLPACQSFDNIFNMRAETRVPGAKVILRTPDVT